MKQAPKSSQPQPASADPGFGQTPPRGAVAARARSSLSSPFALQGPIGNQAAQRSAQPRTLALNQALGNRAVGTMLAELGLGAAPPKALRGITSEGQPIDPSVAQAMTHRLGKEFDGVRVHTGPAAAAAARELRARAYAFGSHVVFGAGQYAPHTPRGRDLLAHELTHVAQQALGVSGSESFWEREADRAQAGERPWLEGAGPPRQRLLLDPGDPLRMTITTASDGSARFQLEVDGGGTFTATGTVAGLDPGVYWMWRGSASRMVFRLADGSELQADARFHIPIARASEMAQSLNRAVHPIPLIVQGSGGALNSETPRQEEPTGIVAIPERVRRLVSSDSGRPPQDADLPVLRRLAELTAGLSDVELAEFAERDTDQQAIASQRRQQQEQEAASRRPPPSRSLEYVHEEYGGWLQAYEMGPQAPGLIAEWERTATAELPQDGHGTTGSAYLRLRRLLQEHGFDNLAAYRRYLEQPAQAGSSGPADFSSLERRLTAFVGEVRERRASEQESQEAMRGLFGLDQVYRAYRAWADAYALLPNASFLRRFESVPVAQLPGSDDVSHGATGAGYFQLRRMLEPHGFPSVASFSAIVDRFVAAFRERAYHHGLEMLDRFERTLVDQEVRYESHAEGTRLYEGLAMPRWYLQHAERYRREQLAEHSGWSPEDVIQSHAAGAYYQRVVAAADQRVARMADEHPLVGTQDFPRRRLAEAPRSGSGNVAEVMRGYAQARLPQVRETRRNLQSNHGLVFSLDNLLAQAKAQQGIAAGSIWDQILTDSQRPTLDQQIVDLAITVFGVALAVLSLVPGPVGVVARVASVPISAAVAASTYRDYELRHAAHGAQLLSEDPSMAWVVVAVVGAGLELAQVAPLLTRLRPALEGIGDAGGLARLEQELAGTEEALRRSIIAAAQRELRFQRGWELVRPPRGALLSSVGPHMVPELVYSLYVSIRRGITRFEQWVRTSQAIGLIGDINSLSPQQLAQLRSNYGAWLADVQRVAEHGAARGMSVDEVDAFVQAWSQHRRGTVTDLMEQMSRRELVVPRDVTTGPVTRSDIGDWRGGVRVTGPQGTYIQLLPVDELGRSRGVIARVDAEMLAQRTGAHATANPPGRMPTQDRAHLLARILGGPDIPQNLTPLLRSVNQRDMRMAEIAIRNAIRDGDSAVVTVTPIFTGSSAQPNRILVSVRWRNGTHEVFAFDNPAGAISPAPAVATPLTGSIPR